MFGACLIVVVFGNACCNFSPSDFRIINIVTIFNEDVFYCQGRKKIYFKCVRARVMKGSLTEK